jgi:hypothetical protein
MSRVRSQGRYRWDGVDRLTTLRCNHDFGIGITRLQLASGLNVFAGLPSSVRVTDDANTGFGLAKALDVSLEIGIAKVVVEHSDGDIEIEVLVLGGGIVLTNAGEVAKSNRVENEGHSVEKRNVVGVTSGRDVGSRVDTGRSGVG